MLEWILLVTFIALIYTAYRYLRQVEMTESRARAIYEVWRNESLEREARERAGQIAMKWTAKEEARIRSDAISRSEAAIRGRITEHLIPYFSNFPYNPKDARFLGTPVDFIVFDGLSSGTLREIVLVEVKSGESARMSPREKSVQDCIRSGNVTFQLIRHPGQEAGDGHSHGRSSGEDPG
ncbi:MAG: Holliday junction resolvase [Methanoregulaceae archaeon]|nr:Holliday junction resolvase [Methanoregulaceae archaeon]